MIHHISIPAENPFQVAQALSQLWKGQVIPFAACAGSYVVLSFDPNGTLIEVYPWGTELIPGEKDEQVYFASNPRSSAYAATHAAISVPVDEAEIMAIATQRGWRAVRCNRDGFFEVIEFWIENRILLELLPPNYVAQYLTFMQPKALQEFLAQMADN
jgi:hypothetical protein